MAKKRGRKRYVYRPFWQGTTWVMSLPAQLFRALQIDKGDKVVIYLNDEGLVLEKYMDHKEYPSNALYSTFRVIGGVTKGEKDEKTFFEQIGFTIPAVLAQQIKNCEFMFPIIVQKDGEYFKIIYKMLTTQVPA